MERLPVELFVHIVSYLDIKDLANLKTVCKRFNNLIYDNIRWMAKGTPTSMILIAKKDAAGKSGVEIVCGEPGLHRILITDTEIIEKKPYYFEPPGSKPNIVQRQPYKKKHENHLVFLQSFSYALSDGRTFDSENPLPCTSLEDVFRETLHFFLSRFNLNLFSLEEVERVFTSTEIGIILDVIKITGPTVGWMRRTTQTIDDQYMEMIKQLKCNDLMFVEYSDRPKEKEKSEYSVNNRILKVPCERLFIYEPSIVSVPTMLLLLKEWKSGSRQIEKYTYQHDQEEGLDWFALIEKDFKIVKHPEEFTCFKGALLLKTFTIARDIDQEELHFYYYRKYLELKTEPKYVNSPAFRPLDDSWEHEGEDPGFGLFD